MNEDYRALFETDEDGCCVIELIFDPTGTRAIDYRFVALNRRFGQNRGVGEVGKTLRELLPEADPFWFEAYGRVALEGTPLRFEHFDPTLRRWFEVQAQRLGLARRAHVSVRFRDITERREMEERLRTSEAMLRGLYDNTSLMMGVVELPDDDSDIIHVYDSEATVHFFGRDVHERPLATARQRGIPDEVLGHWVQAYRRAEREGKEVRFEYEHLTPSGPALLSAALSCIGRTRPGRTRFSFITEDITVERREQERVRARDTHLLLAMSATLSIAFEWDIARNSVRRVQSNEAALPETAGATDTFEGVRAVVHPDDRAAFEANVQHALAAAGGLYQSSHRIVRPGGEVRWLFETGRVEFDVAKKPLRLIGVSQDVTDRHHAEEESRRQAQLTQLSREPIIVWTPERGVLDWNTGAEQLYGHYRAEALGRDVHTLLDTHHPISLAEVMAALEGSGEWTGELRQRAKDGREIIVESRQQVIFVHGERLVLESNRDITERTRTERALRVSEARFRRVFETNLLGIMFFDLSGLLSDANDELLRIIGYGRAELDAGTIELAALTPPEDLATHAQVLEDLRRTGRHPPIEKRFLRKDGSPSWAMLGMAILGGHRCVGFALDISTQKQTEAALRQSDERTRQQANRAEGERAILDAILEAAPAGVVVADANGKLLRVNAANEQLWGPAPLTESIEGYAAWKGWWADRSPRHGQRVEPSEWAMTRALRGETVRDDLIEIEPFDRPGTRRTVVNSGAPVRDGQGHITGAVVAQMDITALSIAEAARAESEARFRAIADALPGLVFVHSSVGRTSFVSQGFREFTGRPVEALLGLEWMACIDPDDLERVRVAIKKAVEEGQRLELEYRLRRHDGALRWHLVRSVPQQRPDGTVSHWVATATDITERKLNEESLQEEGRRKDDFIAILAHELRNPLAPVRNAVEVLRRVGGTDPREQKARDIIDRQLTHMARLIDDLLDVSRIARGKLALQNERCDLTAIARQTAEDYRANLEAAGLQLNLERDANPAWVHGDPVRLTQMIGNLLNNSGRFTNSGGEVRVSTGKDTEGAFVMVSDTGVGIEPRLLSRLFDPFSQAEQDLARTKGGLGLGLALTRGLVELHGGRIDAASAGPGLGSDFTIRLPSIAIPGPRPSQPSVAQEALTEGLRILVIEDNLDAAESLGDLLELEGHQVRLVADGASALAVAREFRPRVVISDLGLPGTMDGYAVARALRTEPSLPGVRLIALSGYANEEARRRSSEAGFDVHLAKPPDLERLQQTLTHFARGP